MAEHRSGEPGGRAERTSPRKDQDRNARAFLVLLAGAAVLYLAIMPVLAALLEAAAGSLSRDRFWKLLIYWAVFIAPAVPALAGAAILTTRLARPFNRAFVYYVATGLLMVGTVVFALFLLVGGGAPGMVLGMLAVGTGLLAWLTLRRILVRQLR